MKFQVLVEGELRSIELVFGSEKELAAISRWRIPEAVSTVFAVRDTIEFARLASKRWRHYRRTVEVLKPYFRMRQNNRGTFFRSERKQKLHGIGAAPEELEVKYQNA